MTTKWRQYLLAALLVVVVAVGLVTMTGGGDPAETPRRPSNKASRAANEQVEIPVADVGLGRLKAERDELQPAERNPFRFRPKPQPPPPPPVVIPVARQPQPVGPAVPAGPPPPPPITLKYIGFADEAGPVTRFGVFSDGRGTVMNAKEGDILEGRYRVLRVGTDSADLVYLDGRGRQTLRLSGQ